MELMVFWIGCAVFSWVVANSRGRMAGAWFILGLIFGPLALITVGLMPSVSRVDEPSARTHVKCPDCRELVLIDARVCKHCRCKLVPQAA